MLALLFGVAFGAAALLLMERAAESRDRRLYPPPGRLTPDSNLHFTEMGVGGPCVILESGLTASSISWVVAQERISDFARVVAYDRAGLGWSTPASMPLSLTKLIEDLHSLVSADLPPVILAGHSFGGLLVSAFAHEHPELVSGLVLIDPVSIATFANPSAYDRERLRRGIRLSKRGAFLARFGIVRGALWLVARGSRRLPSLIGRVSAGRGSSMMNRLAAELAKLPRDTHGPIRSSWSRPTSFLLMAEYLRLLPEAASQARTMPIPDEIPVIVLSAASAKRDELAERDAWIRNHPRSRHTQVPGTTHWLHLDRPDAVAEAVRELSVPIK